MPTAFANGIEIYFERAGSGRSLRFLNGSRTTLETAKLLVDHIGWSACARARRKTPPAIPDGLDFQTEG